MLREALFLVVLCLVAWIGFDALEGQRDEARRERDSAKWEASGLREAARISGEMLAERDAIDQRNTKELTDARNENERLRRAVGDGSDRLLVRATCPASGSVSATAGTARVADAGRAELSADARSDYFTLRDQLAKSRQMIVGLQQYALGVCRRSPAPQDTTFPNLKKSDTP
ncbi:MULTISPECIES: lysis system i-spanin subunit Rz [Pseudomonas]|uniref:Lysis protein n=1 Tax=Pseudomonas aphyarum TaxID=2942629 RepID=A0ABT5PNP3_9PSED|nr:lysis system i-spanin subunit Rz [Pseudomonas aphyarum]MDD0969371.1 lysis protein [Pseudomonas aphyarum]MDD1125530.1 lysis protein [Pseudomonas aphyarum]